ncbi:hypothetical protein FRB95_002618 [Tulasnella sp. JGI-2019a]|nr:hypothetical protein FRB95_002618 [Tulasnella sp. JGI-2019a]
MKKSRSRIVLQPKVKVSALGIVDILEQIVRHLPRSGRAAAAGVCRNWQDVTLAGLWEDLDSILPLLRLLAPVNGYGQKGQPYSFQGSLRDADWGKFDSYAQMVRSLKWDDEYGTLTDTIFSQLFLHRPHTHALLPNITEITWGACYEATATQILPILAQSVKTLRLHFKDQCPVHSFTTILKGLVDRGILLEELNLMAWFDVDTVDPQLTSYLWAQTNLKRIGLPQYYGSTTIITALGTLPELQVVLPTNLQAERESGRQWELAEGTFTNLSSFGLNECLIRATHVFRQTNLSKIRHVHLITPVTNATSSGLNPFLLTLVTACPHLQGVTLNLYQNPTTFQAIDFSTLQPLLKCRELQVLEIADRKPLILTEVDIRDMATAWPELQRVDLTPEPIDALAATVGNPLSLLNRFASSFGKSLTTIGLFFNINRADIIDNRGFSMLPSLHTLIVGSSLVTQNDIIPTAAFLGGICSAGLVVKAGRRSWSKAVHDWGVMNNELPTVKLWKKTAEAIQDVHALQRPRQYRLEDMESKSRRVIDGKSCSWRQIDGKGE